MRSVRHDHSLPSLSYQQAMAMVITVNGRQWQVRHAPVNDFRAYVEQLAENDPGAKRELHSLLFTSLPDRWFALLMLTERELLQQ